MFTTGLSLVCALLLTGVSSALAERQARNRRLDEIANILAVLRIDTGADASAKEVEASYEANVSKAEKAGVTIYTYRGVGLSAPAKAYAFAVHGMGLWGPVKGLIAVEPDLETIRGVRFYEHEETPGLGGRIGEREFTHSFAGKCLVSPDGSAGIRIVSGAKGRNEVDAITGATLTCRAVEKFVNEDIKAFLKAMR